MSARRGFVAAAGPAVAAAVATLLAGELAPQCVAHAAGLYIPGVGGPGQARAGAFITAPSDISAFWYNPAALVDLDGVRVSYENTFVVAHVFFDRLDDPDVNSDDDGLFAPVRNGAGPFYIPMLGITAATGRGVTFGLAFFAPHAGTYEFPEDGPQRYASIMSDTGQTFVEAAVGARLGARVDVGLSAGVSSIFVNESFAIQAYLLANERRGTEAVLHIAAVHALAPSLGAAVRVRLGGGFVAALSARAPVAVRAKGRVEVALGPELVASGVAIEGDEVEVLLHMPLIANAALGWTCACERLQVELAATFENWGSLDRVLVDASRVSVVADTFGLSGPVGVVSIDRGLRDAFSVKLGADWEALRDRLWLRLGLGFESSGTRPERYTPSSADGSKVILGAGVTIRVWRFDLALSYMRLMQPEMIVADSEYDQLNALVEEEVTIVGNGTYRASFDVVSAMLTVRFGGPKNPKAPLYFD